MLQSQKITPARFACLFFTVVSIIFFIQNGKFLTPIQVMTVMEVQRIMMATFLARN